MGVIGANTRRVAAVRRIVSEEMRRGPRLEINFSDEAYERLSATAADCGRTPGEVVRRALNIEDYLRRKQQGGSRFFVEYPDGSRKELLIA